MDKLLRVSERHQITLPPQVLRDAGIGEGAYLSVQARAGKIILEPAKVAEGDLSEEDWKKLDAFVSRQVQAGAFTEYSSPKAAKRRFK